MDQGKTTAETTTTLLAGAMKDMSTIAMNVNVRSMNLSMKKFTSVIVATKKYLCLN